jgi:hypothetical protein
MAKTKLGDGAHDLTVVLGERQGNDVDAAQVAFVVPQVVPDVLMLRGPVVGRVARGGAIFRGRPHDRPSETLLVHEVAADDEVLFYWSGCVVGTSPLPSDVVVKSRVVAASGEAVVSLDPVPLSLEARGKNVLCADSLERVAAASLSPGDYSLDVTVVHPDGSVIARGSEPLTVR